jgi:hypothetical protein
MNSKGRCSHFGPAKPFLRQCEGSRKVRDTEEEVKVGESTVDGPAARVNRPAPTEIVDSQGSIVSTDSVEESTQIVASQQCNV